MEIVWYTNYTIIEIANIHADASTLDACKDQDVVRKAADLIELWCSWADNRTDMYPFRDTAYEDMLHDLLESVWFLLALLSFFFFLL